MLSRVVSGHATTAETSASERIRALEDQVRVVEEARKRAENQARRLTEERDSLAAWKVDAEKRLADSRKLFEERDALAAWKVIAEGSLAQSRKQLPATVNSWRPCKTRTLRWKARFPWKG